MNSVFGEHSLWRSVCCLVCTFTSMLRVRECDAEQSIFYFFEFTRTKGSERLATAFHILMLSTKNLFCICQTEFSVWFENVSASTAVSRAHGALEKQTYPLSREGKGGGGGAVNKAKHHSPFVSCLCGVQQTCDAQTFPSAMKLKLLIRNWFACAHTSNWTAS